jgi:hypothetical protein
VVIFLKHGGGVGEGAYQMVDLVEPISEVQSVFEQSAEV